jgi:hypothetical protein
MPVGTRRRDTITAALELARVSRRFRRDVAQLVRKGDEVVTAAGRVVRAAGLALPATPYPIWLAHQRTASRLATDDVPAGSGLSDSIPVSFVILTEEGGPARTTAMSLRSQIWPHVGIAVAGDAPLGSAGPDSVGGDRAGVWESASRASLEGDDRGFVVFLRAGDLMDPDTALRIADAGWRDPAAELVYWDDDVRGPGGFPTSPRFRPGWSPDMLLGANYLGHSFAIRRRALRAAGGLRGELGDEALWDLLLRCRLRPHQVVRIPLVLGHIESRNDDVSDIGLRVVRDHLNMGGQRASVERWQGMARIRW